MPSERRAVIDVGTNSVKLLIGDVSKKGVEPILETSQQTRLGRGFYTTHHLQPDAIQNTAIAVNDFAQVARKNGAQDIRLIATSAARDAKNSGDLMAAIQNLSGLDLKIISGEQEADWAFRGVATNPEFASQKLLILDVGGGSTEFIAGSGQHKHFCESFPIGSVRLMESRFAGPHSDPPTAEELARCRKWLREFLETKVRPELEPALDRERKSGAKDTSLVGTGGTANILARMELKLDSFDRERIEGLRLSREQVVGWTNHLWQLPLAERRRIVGLPPERADVILTGVAIYEAVMEKLSFEDLRVTTRGLRFAALMN